MPEWVMETLQPLVKVESRLAGDDNCVECEDAFRSFVERQSRLALKVAYSVLRNAEDAEDAVQEAFFKVYRGRAWLRADDERAFLARTVWRAAVDLLPRKAQNPMAGDIPAVNATPEDAAISADLSAIIHRLVDALPQELRQPLALSTVEELTSGEIARVMGIPEGTVRTRMMRARQILKEKLIALRRGRDAK